MLAANKKGTRGKASIKATELLKQQILLRNVADDVIEGIIPHLEFRRYIKGESVAKKGDVTSSLLMLFSGRLQVIALSESGQKVGLGFIEPGDYYGELSIIDGGPNSESIVAAASSVIGVLPKSEAQVLFYQNPAVAETLLQQQCRRIRQTSSHRSILSLARSNARVYSVLQASIKETAHGQLMIENLPTQQAIAFMANVSRETVSRAIRSLVDYQIVERDHRNLLVIDAQRLRKLAKGQAEIPAITTSPDVARRS